MIATSDGLDVRLIFLCPFLTFRNLFIGEAVILLFRNLGGYNIRTICDAHIILVASELKFGKQFSNLLDECIFILEFCKHARRRKEIKPYVKQLVRLTRQWRSLTRKIGFAAMKNRDAVGAASVDYIMFSGYLLLGVAWAASAQAAYRRLEQGTKEEAFYLSKIQTADFYFAKILPRTTSLLQTMLAGPESLMTIDEDHFVF